MPQFSMEGTLTISRRGKKLGAFLGVAPTAAVSVGGRRYLLLGRADYASRPLHLLELVGGTLTVRQGDLKPVAL